MGFWHTGYLDKIDTGYAGHTFSNKPPVYNCSHCTAQFASQDDLLQHRFQEHPFQRPTLLLRGEELLSSRKILTRPIVAEDVIAVLCERAIVDNQDIMPEDIGNFLEANQKGIKRITLENHGISTECELHFVIPDDEDIREIDRRFFEFTAGGSLDVHTIDKFVDATKSHKSATQYQDGLTQYLYGILAKDQKGNTCLEMSKYKGKYNLALDALHDFETSTARIISSIVNFNMNVFDSHHLLDEVPKLQASMYFFQKSLFRGPEHPTSVVKAESFSSREKIPLDSFTDKVIDWSLAPDEEIGKNIKYIVDQLNGTYFPPDDQFKLRVIAAEYTYRLKDFSQVRALVRPVTNDALYGAWAEYLLREI